MNPTRDKKIERIRHCIRVAVPDLMNLQIGCKLINKHTKTSYDKPNVFIRKVGNSIHAYRPSFDEFGNFPKDAFEVIGRDIMFDDIILAIKHHFGNNTDARYGIIHTAVGSACFAVTNRWEWGKPLHEQKTETVAFVYKLFKGKWLECAKL